MRQQTLIRITILAALLFGASTASARRGPRIKRGALSPRVERPVQISFSQKHLLFSGAEVGFRFLNGHLEGHLGLGANLLPEDTLTLCSATGCTSEQRLMLEGGLRWYPMYGPFSPYVSLGMMGSPTDDAPIGLAGAGIHWNSRFGLTINAGVDVVIGEIEPERRFLPTLTVGYAF